MNRSQIRYPESVKVAEDAAVRIVKFFFPQATEQQIYTWRNETKWPYNHTARLQVCFWVNGDRRQPLEVSVRLNLIDDCWVVNQHFCQFISTPRDMCESDQNWWAQVRLIGDGVIVEDQIWVEPDDTSTYPFPKKPVPYHL